jgi:hypothetical protein
MLLSMSVAVTPGMGRGALARYRLVVFTVDRISRDAIERSGSAGPRSAERCGPWIDDATLRPLHAWSTRLMAEGYDHFARHALTNDELHVFRRGDEIVGFQFWRAFTMERTRYVLGGKLRVDPAARRNGLHHASNLAILRAQRAAHPAMPLVRLSIASLFGFVSLARAMPLYRFVDAATEPALAAVFERVAADNDYAFDPATGLVDVGIAIPPDQLATFSRSYFEMPEARVYVGRNADFAHNRCFVAVAFDADEGNLTHLAKRCAVSVVISPG